MQVQPAPPPPPPAPEPAVLSRIVKAEELARVSQTGIGVEVRMPDGSWAPAAVTDRAYRTAIESLNITLKNWAHSLGWQEAYKRMGTTLDPVRMQQGVSRVDAGLDGITVTLRDFESRAQVDATRWAKVTLNGTILFSSNIVRCGETSGRFMGRAVGRWPNVQSGGGICLDMGMTFYQAAMKAGDALQGILGVLTQMRSLNDNGYTRIGIWLGIGCRGCGAAGNPTLGGFCSYCKRKCKVCGEWAVLSASNGLYTDCDMHMLCLRTCRVCRNVPAQPQECPESECAVCGKMGKHRNMVKLTNKANLGQAAHQTCSTSHDCGFVIARGSGCSICGGACFSCGKYVKQSERVMGCDPSNPSGPYYYLHISCSRGASWECGVCGIRFLGTHTECPRFSSQENHAVAYATLHPFTDADYAAAGERRIGDIDLEEREELSPDPEEPPPDVEDDEDSDQDED